MYRRARTTDVHRRRNRPALPIGGRSQRDGAFGRANPSYEKDGTNWSDECPQVRLKVSVMEGRRTDACVRA